jgi:cell division transport system permease protein
MRRRTQRPGVGDRINAYLREHAHILAFSLRRLARAPMASLMTTAVIGIALALPAGLYVLLNNLQALTGDWDGTVRISLFLKPGTPVEALRPLAERVRARNDVAQVQTITARQALEEFKRSSGLETALESLEENPLPHVLVVSPPASGGDSARVEALARALRQLPEVDLAQLDMEWLQRLYALLEIARRVLTGIALMLALAVLLIVGNTIRLDIENRRAEIEVTKLIGATNGFIRRPFLYGGVWYGVLGGILAWLMVFAALTLIETPVERLAGLYHSQYRLLGLGASDSLTLFLLATLLGLAGSWLAVGRHLRTIEPR